MSTVIVDIIINIQLNEHMQHKIILYHCSQGGYCERSWLDVDTAVWSSIQQHQGCYCCAIEPWKTLLCYNIVLSLPACAANAMQHAEDFVL